LIAEEFGVPPPRLRFPIWPVWIAGALCEAVCVPFGIEPPLFRRRVDFYRKSRAFSIARARTELGYNPTIDLRTGIRRTAEWYRTRGLL
jgi:dihydroflavonol-4-reductase